uniref:Zinc finger and BTB domain containing 21 n=1 Tax=Scleropages formosus TaxID=113540 RepID=A0A8C9U332_SCLFO
MTRTKLDNVFISSRRMENLVHYINPVHTFSLLSMLNEQRLSGHLCDVTLIVADQKFHAHRSVLAASSEYFQALFARTDSDVHAVVHLDFCEPDVLEHVLNYIYSSSLFVDKESLTAIQELGYSLGISFLTNIMTTKPQISYSISRKAVFAEGNDSGCLPENVIVYQRNIYKTDESLSHVKGESFLGKSPSNQTPSSESPAAESGQCSSRTCQTPEGDRGPETLGNAEVRKVELGNEGGVLKKSRSINEEQLSEDQSLGITFKSSNSSLKEHQQSRTSKCKNCMRTFRSSAALHRHMNMFHNPEKPYACDICHKQFHTNFKNLRTVEPSLWSCEKCGKVFSALRELEHHQELLCYIKPFICNICQKSFRTNFRLWSHIQSHASNPDASGSRENSQLPSRLSPSPPLLATNVEESPISVAKSTAQNSTGGDPLRRTHQQNIQVSRQEVDAMSSHSPAPPALAAERQYVCKLCRRTFRSAFSLWSHEQSHSSS